MTERELRILEIAAEALDVSQQRNHLAALIRQAVAELRQVAPTPQRWHPLDTFDGRAVYVLVQDGEEVYRAACQSDGWWCDEGYRVHPTHWMPFANGAAR